MDERLRFVARLLDGEAMSEVCRAFGISRKTGYKIFERYKEHGLEALTDRSRRRVRYANHLFSHLEGQGSHTNLPRSRRSCPPFGRLWRPVPRSASSSPCNRHRLRRARRFSVQRHALSRRHARWGRLYLQQFFGAMLCRGERIGERPRPWL
jgi:helix-turn-helix protein